PPGRFSIATFRRREGRRSDALLDVVRPATGRPKTRPVSPGLPAHGHLARDASGFRCRRVAAACSTPYPEDREWPEWAHGGPPASEPSSLRRTNSLRFRRKLVNSLKERHRAAMDPCCAP